MSRVEKASHVMPQPRGWLLKLYGGEARFDMLPPPLHERLAAWAWLAVVGIFYIRAVLFYSKWI